MLAYLYCRGLEWVLQSSEASFFRTWGAPIKAKLPLM